MYDSKKVKRDPGKYLNISDNEVPSYKDQWYGWECLSEKGMFIPSLKANFINQRCFRAHEWYIYVPQIITTHKD